MTTPTDRPEDAKARDLRGERLYPARNLTWPVGELHEIEWREREAVAV
jgi:hypothetical protein